ncbi:pyridoxal phosphate-dependent decarboxylase family protein [Pseudonocardia sp. TRM90224]|uniref:pyridoxal phosphate-dependent decarboxylase family protein n=1 Tax=Pseudonocardia sp. TRM90224 TaxID=2812678 RepID=UPI001E480AD6|nr:aminotransferase class V-fold PLP-dependent enzyme [Pseudonocardia sp. TRM90224]
MDLPPLRLTSEEMRALGYQAVDSVVEHLTTMPTRAVGRPPDPAELARRFDPALPAGGSDPAELLTRTIDDLMATIVHTDHPRFLAYVPGPSNYISALADFLAAGLNVFAGQGLVAAGPAVIERITVDWLRQLCGLPAGGGLFVSGGTMANLVALHAARVELGADLAVYITDHTHRSIRKGLRFLGIDDARVRTIALDTAFRMDVRELDRTLAADRRAGTRAQCVIATAGTTGTGAVDPLNDIADACAADAVWLHVDGAYGAAAVLSERQHPLLAGLSRADSIALDPHKWWFQPYEIGCVLVRDPALLTNAFSMEAEYLRETRSESVPLNFYDLGPQLTRSFRALKLWMSVHAFGIDAFRQAVEHGIELAEHAQRVIEAAPEWELVTPAQLAVLTFRPRVPDRSSDEIAQLTRRVAAATLQDGYALVTTTEVDAEPVLRLCTTHPQTTVADIESTLQRLGRSVANL